MNKPYHPSFPAPYETIIFFQKELMPILWKRLLFLLLFDILIPAIVLPFIAKSFGGNISIIGTIALIYFIFVTLVISRITKSKRQYLS